MTSADKGIEKVAMMRWQEYCAYKGPGCGQCYKPGHWVERPDCFKGTQSVDNYRLQMETERFNNLVLNAQINVLIKLGRVKTIQQALELIEWIGLMAGKQLSDVREGGG